MNRIVLILIIILILILLVLVTLINIVKNWRNKNHSPLFYLF